MFFNKFRLQKNTCFHYTPRYYKGVEKENSYEIKSKYDKKDQGLNYNDFKGQWTVARKESRTRGNYRVTNRLLIIICILVLLFLYLIDFDLSIFSKP